MFKNVLKLDVVDMVIIILNIFLVQLTPVFFTREMVFWLNTLTGSSMWKFMWDDTVSQPLYVHCDLCLGKLKGL